MIKWIRRKLAMRRYQRWYDKMCPYFEENPDRLEAFVIALRKDYNETGNAFSKIAADWSDNYLEESGYYDRRTTGKDKQTTGNVLPFRYQKRSTPKRVG